MALNNLHKTASHLALAGIICLGLSACSAGGRLQNIGQAPALSTIDNPVQQKNYQPVALPMPAPNVQSPADNSLWRAGSRSFFKDQRASTIGDILTVEIDINDNASINNESSRTRDNSESAGMPNLLGVEGNLGNFLPDGVSASSLVDLSSASNHTGSGAITRDETIELKIAALVTQILPNGNMVIQGRQEVRVNFEVRDLLITGVIRPEDIRNDNTISYEKIAEARVSYGGRGQITDVQQPRYGQQLYDIIFPF